MKIPFNKPLVLGTELDYIKKALANRKLSGDGEFTKRCQEFMESRFRAEKVLLTPSCTQALEMAAMLCDIEKGDEVICPSFTFVSSINSFVLRGGIPKFIDIKPDTLNLNEQLIKEAINEKTKAIMPVHYAGVGCEMQTIKDIAHQHGISVIEDAAQGVNSKFNGGYLGTFGEFGAYSFHETKNYTSGEGGALVLNNPEFIERAEIIREKGTNRKKFFKGEVDKYTWVDIGSSYLPSELQAAFLYGQLKSLDEIQQKRKYLYERYLDGLEALDEEGKIKLPTIPSNCESNYHLFHIITRNPRERADLLEHLQNNGVHAVFHYIPLHTSEMGKNFGNERCDLPVTEDLSERLIRLPLYYDLSAEEIDYIIKKVEKGVAEFPSD